MKRFYDFFHLISKSISKRINKNNKIQLKVKQTEGKGCFAQTLNYKQEYKLQEI